MIKRWLESEYRKHGYLSEKLGVSGSTVDAMLRGRVPRDRETVETLASLMGCRVEDLLIPIERKAA